MNEIRKVKESADILKVAQYFHFNLNKSNKCLCPFHLENTPSFSISEKKQIWKCFGCGKGGDVIALVSELLHINAYESAKQINNICNLGISFNNSKLTIREIRTNKSNLNLVNQFKKWEINVFNLLCDYLHILKHWEENYIPTKFSEEFNELYIKALQEKDKILYYIDLFIYGTNDDKIWFYENEKNYIKQIIFNIKKGEKNNE